MTTTATTSSTTLPVSTDDQKSPALVAADLAVVAERADALAKDARARNTLRAYRSDLVHFERWCRAHGLASIPAAPTTIGFYLTAHETTLSMATLTRRLSAVAVAHRLAGHGIDTKAPAIRDVLRGLRRAKSVAARQVAPLTTPVLRQLLSTCGDRLLDLRDRALLLVGFAAALRRSELVGLDLADIAVSSEGLKITLRRSKADQEGAGAVVAVMRTGSPTCPVTAYADWLSAAGITSGRSFRSLDRHGRLGAALSASAVAEIVKRRAALAGVDAASVSAHSLRRGFCTAAALAGVEERAIMKQSRHASVMTVRRYIRDGQVFMRNLSVEVGL